MKKLLIFVVAVVLIAAVIGTCFALYKTKPEDPVVISIGGDYESFELSIKDKTANTAQANLAFTGENAFNPTNHTKTIDVRLCVDDSSLVNGAQGKLTVGIEGALEEYISVNVETFEDDWTTPANTLSAVSGGWQGALSDTPIFTRITLALTEAAKANFASVAEKTADLTISWTVVEGTVWSYDNEAYYLVGDLYYIDQDHNGWTVSEDYHNYKLTSHTVEEDPLNIATGQVYLPANVEILVLKGDNSTWVKSYSPAVEGKFYNDAEQLHIESTGAGLYNIWIQRDTGKFYIEFAE